MLKALLMIDTMFCSSQECIRFLKLKVLLEDSYLRPHVHLRSTLVRLGRDPRFGKSRVAKRKPREQQKKYQELGVHVGEYPAEASVACTSQTSDPVGTSSGISTGKETLFKRILAFFRSSTSSSDAAIVERNGKATRRHVPLGA